ncbi:uncharacterized protein CEXT_343201 [Caerostris extrusa]|uniref:Uncharacterized protein n=1 Tax=Caerostris extrusa TaxID=172846 RepID=A0AAV4RI94_CAEEX|nr:uncharacterized protein CEXT_343201 [Caerostris extrusa]
MEYDLGSILLVFGTRERKLEVRRRSDTALVLTINDASQRSGCVPQMTRRAASGKPKLVGSGGRLGNPLNLLRAWDRGLQLFPFNEEFPVSASHKLVLITSLPFVHTARHYYRLNDLVRSLDWPSWSCRAPVRRPH